MEEAERLVRNLSVSDNWLDITELLKEAVNKMEDGQMVFSSSFSLYESMAAFEIMHPKMDSGMVSSKPPRFNMTDIAYYRHKSLEDVEDIVLALLIMLGTWLKGKTLAQTLFMSAFMNLKPHEIQDDLIRFAVELVWTLVLLCSQLVQDAVVNFEEDLIMNMFGLIVDMDENACEQKWDAISRKLDQETDDTKRAQIIREMFQFMLNLIRILKDVRQVKVNMDTLDETKNLINIICNRKSELVVENVYGVDFQISKKLSTSIPIQPTPQLTLKEAGEVFIQFIDSLNEASGFSDARSVLSLLAKIQLFYASDPGILGRSSAIFLLSQVKLYVLMEQSIKTFTGFPYFKKESLAERLSPFVSSLVQCFQFLTRISMYNEGRRLRKLLKSLILWDYLQHDAEQLDRAVEPSFGTKDAYYLANWVYYFKVNLMIETINLHFKNELIGQNDLAYHLWYIDYLCTVQQQTLERILSTGTKKSSQDTEVLLLWTAANQSLARGLHRLLSALQKDSFIKLSITEESKEKQFNHRFRHFKPLASPEPVAYSTYSENTNLDHLEATFLYHSAGEMFEYSKKYITQLITLQKNGASLEELCISKAGKNGCLEALNKIAFGNAMSVKVVLAKREEFQKRGVELSFNNNFSCVYPVVTARPKS